MLSNTKVGEEEGKGGHIQNYSIGFPKLAVTRDGALLSWRWLNTCLTMGSSE